nr:PREDICTED: cytochrome P450 4C1 [Tribolium castaneum]|eukprot:XP_015836253.1 PREDICTED: cytochrome P450 4C1 [Tribolium castaneum]
MIEKIDLTSVFLTLFLAFIIKYNWDRRWLYYYGSKIDGPLGWPIFGSAHYLMGGHKVFYKNVNMLLKSYPSEVAKIWVGPTLLVSITKPEDVEIVLNKCLERPKFYEFGKEIVGSGILTAPIDVWKSRRKMINPTFNPNILNSFVEIFGRHAFYLTNALEENCGKDSFDILPKLFRCTFDTACETFGDVDSTLLHGRDEIFQNLTKAEDLVKTRGFTVWLHFEFFWNMTSLCKEYNQACNLLISIVKQIIQLKKPSYISDNNHREKRLLNHLLKLSKINAKIDQTALEDEIQTILLTGSETTALTVGLTLIILGIYPEIQKKIGKELDVIFGKDDRVPTLEDINRMEYLERVIKETLRFLTPVPFMLRTNNQDITLDSNTIPAGSCIMIPIFHIHKKPEYWKNPNEFDPDRFLPENSSKRPRCAFIPFSSGPRNCIGFKYGMMSVKVLLAVILRKYTVVATEYKKVEDIEMLFYVVNKPISGCKIKLEKK